MVDFNITNAQKASEYSYNSVQKRTSENSQGQDFGIFVDRVGKKSFTELKASSSNFEVINDADWQALINSGDAEKIDAAYKKAFDELGKSYNLYLDRRAGNGDGKLTFEEFKNCGLLDNANGNSLLKKAFNNFDLNNDKNITQNEMAAFLRLVDNSVNPNGKSGDNAKIDEYSLAARLLAMGNSQMKDNISAAHKHLFGTDK